MLALLALVAVSAASPVTVAAGHLKAGKLDDLVFDLADSVPIPPDDTAAAARLLGQGAVQAEQKGDPMLALQLAQTAHRRDPKQLDALKVLTERAMHDQSFTEADGYADTLESLAPSDVHLTLLRAQVAAAEEDWDRATSISGLLLGKTSLSKTEQKEAQQIHDRAALAVAHRGAADDALAAQRQQLHAAAEVAAQQRDEAFKADAVGKRIVVYGTSWCGFCKQARKYFADHQLAFEDKDVERDPDAAEELKTKMASAGLHGNGVPVIDVYGTLVQGFDRAKVERILQREGN